MSMRQIAKEMGITPAYLSYMVNGKRPWREDLHERYCQLVNTSVNRLAEIVNTRSRRSGDPIVVDGTKARSIIDTFRRNSGAGDRIRTDDHLLGKQTLYR